MNHSTTTIRKTVHAFCDDVLADHDAVGIADLIRQREIQPSEVVAAAIARANRVDPQLFAIEHEGFQGAIDIANTHQTGFFAGVPTLIKDDTQVEGFPTNHGSEAVHSDPAAQHEPLAQQYLDQGFVCLGKSSLPEFGLNASTEHKSKSPTCNPWNRDFSCGGSSGGSAALVAAGVVPIAHAKDGGGSIRIPAACCGLIGLKPTRRRLIQPAMGKALPVNILVDGVVTRSVRDTAFFFTEAEKSYRNRKLKPFGIVQGPSRRRLKIGYVIDSITGHATDEQTRNALLETVSLLEDLGHQARPVPLPVSKSLETDFGLYWAMLAFFIKRFGKREISPSFDAQRLNALTEGLSSYYRKNFWRTPAFLFRLKKQAARWQQSFKEIDVMLSPVVSHTTPKLGHLDPNLPFDEIFSRLVRFVSFTPFANAAGGPAISLPMGQAKSNLPIGLHFSADHGEEKTLIELAYELEEAQPWRKIQEE